MGGVEERRWSLRFLTVRMRDSRALGCCGSNRKEEVQGVREVRGTGEMVEKELERGKEGTLILILTVASLISVYGILNPLVSIFISI